MSTVTESFGSMVFDERAMKARLSGSVYHAMKQTLREGKPLVQRVVTAGGLMNNPGNYLVRVGTRVRSLIEACGGVKPEVRQLVNGGPMMGVAFNDVDAPITKGTSGILALGPEAIDPPEGPCIRCGRCMRHCPMKLLPVHMDQNVRDENYEEAERLGIMSCIECGACTYVCPAKRMLTQSFRMGKKVIAARQRAAKEIAQKAQEELKKEQEAAGKEAK